MDQLADILKLRGISICSIESFTVGGFASYIGSISGISSVYKGSLVSYQTCIKQNVLGIDKDIIDAYGVVSKEVAYLMASHGQKMFDCDLCISFTGNAGPSAMENKPVGLIYIGIAYHDDIYTFSYHLSGNRLDIQKQAIDLGIQNILDIIKEND